MSKVGIAIKIDVTNIDKNRLFSGSKGTYLDATAFVDIDEFDQYGHSGMITQDVTKEERQNGVKGPILGNTKVFWKGDSNGIAGQQPQQTAQQQSQDFQYEQGGGAMGDDMPFSPVPYI